MAILTNSDFVKIREIINNYPEAKAEFKSLNLAKLVWKATFQALENWFVGAFNNVPTTSVRGAIDTATTATTTGQDQILVEIWFEFKQWKRSQA